AVGGPEAAWPAADVLGGGTGGGLAQQRRWPLNTRLQTPQQARTFSTNRTSGITREKSTPPSLICWESAPQRRARPHRLWGRPAHAAVRCSWGLAASDRQRCSRPIRQISLRRLRRSASWNGASDLQCKSDDLWRSMTRPERGVHP